MKTNLVLYSKVKYYSHMKRDHSVICTSFCCGLFARRFVVCSPLSISAQRWNKSLSVNACIKYTFRP